MSEPVPSTADLCAAVLTRIDAIVIELVTEIRREFQTYVAMPLAEHRRTIRELLGLVLGGIGTDAEPSADDLHWVRQASRRRADHGLAIEDVLGSFTLFAMQLWDEFRTASGGSPAAAEAELAAVRLLWRWMQALSGVVAGAYAQEAGMRGTRDVMLRLRFLDELLGGSVLDGSDIDGTARTARELGFDPDGEFEVACAVAADWPLEKVELLQRELGQLDGRTVAAVRDGHLVVVSQSPAPQSVADRLHTLGGPRVRFGLGLARRGLPGARDSFADARLALEIGRHRPGLGGVVCFADEWLPASLWAVRERLDPLLASARRVAAAQPHLAQALEAFGASGFSLAGAAQALSVHPNTAAYRLGRWQELTGLDPRSLPGLLQSLMALRLPVPGESPESGADKSSDRPKTGRRARP